VNAISTWAEGALEEIGLKNLPGFADGDVFGYAYSPLALDTKTQTRSSAETSYLREALAQTTNLNVYKNAIAKKIIFEGNKAVAATVETGNVQFRINATREVIVSAGTVRNMAHAYLAEPSLGTGADFVP
jgi:choline dehydrogenase